MVARTKAKIMSEKQPSKDTANISPDQRHYQYTNATITVLGYQTLLLLASLECFSFGLTSLYHQF